MIISKDLQESGHKKWLTISIILAKRGVVSELTVEEDGMLLLIVDIMRF